MRVRRLPPGLRWFVLLPGLLCASVFTTNAGILTASAQAAVPEEFRYVCPDPTHPKTYPHPGRCPLCGKLLEADAPSGVEVEYVCPRHPSRQPVSTPGVCPVPGCGHYLQARHVQPAPKQTAQYVCPDPAHAKRYDKPGRCPLCGKFLRVWNPYHLPVEYVCPTHPEVVSDDPGRCPDKDCVLYLEARWLQPKPAGKFIYRCPLEDHTRQYDRPGRCPLCGMYLEARTKRPVRYVCPNPDHAYYLDRAGRCGVAGCPYYLEARLYTAPPPPKKAWYETAWTWVAGWFHGLHGRRRKGSP